MHSPVQQQESGGRKTEDVADLIQRYSNYLHSLLKSPKTILEYSKDVRAWAAWWGRDPGDFGPDAWDEWVSAQVHDGLSGRSIRRHQSAIRKFFKFLRRRKLVSHDPSADAEPIGIVRRLPVVLSEEEVAILRARAKSPRNKAILSLLYGCGLRNQELRSIELEDFDARELRVRGKGGKERIVPLPQETHPLVKAWLARRPITESRLLFCTGAGRKLDEGQITKLVKRLALGAGILKHVTPHVLRHSVATHLLKRGANLVAIQEFLGHEDLNTTRIYLHLANQEMQAAILSAHPMTNGAPGVAPEAPIAGDCQY